MKFVIASVEFWESAGFDTSNWRKSTDGSLALVHLEYAKALVPDVEVNENTEIYDCPGAEFEALLESGVWL